MNQPSLFDSLEKPAEPRPVRLEPIRKYLNHQLRQMRRATSMPWHKADADYHAKYFPIYASELPEDEAAGLVAEFDAQLARLKAVQ
jgi:hypothetical protein